MDDNKSSGQFPLPGIALVPLAPGVFVFTENSFNPTRPDVPTGLTTTAEKVQDTPRLGQSTRLKPEGIHQGYVQKLVRYLDFTDGKGIDCEHEIFTRNNKQIDGNIVAISGRIFRDEANKLPSKKRLSASGFSMMQSVPMVYKPQLIVENEICVMAHMRRSVWLNH